MSSLKRPRASDDEERNDDDNGERGSDAWLKRTLEVREDDCMDGGDAGACAWWRPVIEGSGWNAGGASTSAAGTSEDDEFAGVHIPSDEEAAIEMLLRDGWRLWSGEKADPLAVITESQLYTVIHDKSAVDMAVQRLSRRGSILRFQLASARDDYGIVRCSDVISMIASKIHDATRPKEKAFLRIFAMRVLSQCRCDVEIFNSNLMDILSGNTGTNCRRSLAAQRPSLSSQSRAVVNLPMSVVEANECVSFLVNAGFMRRSQHDSLLFSLPGIGHLVSSLSAARKAVLASIERKRYPEILEKELKKKKLLAAQKKGCPVGCVDYVLRDLIGSGKIVTVPTTSGRLLRLGRLR